MFDRERQFLEIVDPSLRLVFPSTPQQSRLSKWFGLPFPPGWWPCCCKSSPSTPSGYSQGSHLDSIVCCTDQVPDVLNVTFSNSGSCAMFDGLTFPLRFSNSLDAIPRSNCAGKQGWSCPVANCTTAGVAGELQFCCKWQLQFPNGNTGVPNSANPCRPISWGPYCTQLSNSGSTFCDNPGPACSHPFPFVNLCYTVTE